MMRLDEISENYNNLKVKVVSDTTNKTEQTRGGLKEMHVPMDVDHVSGSEPEVEDWENVMGHFARDCGRKGKGKETGGDGGKGYAKGEGKTTTGTGKKGSSNFGGLRVAYVTRVSMVSSSLR